MCLSTLKQIPVTLYPEAWYNQQKCPSNHYRSLVCYEILFFTRYVALLYDDETVPYSLSSNTARAYVSSVTPLLCCLVWKFF